MDELQKLLENAGVCENGPDYDVAMGSAADVDALNRLSRDYKFDGSDDGRINVYALSGDNDRYNKIAMFDSFDDMLQNFGNM